jgi:hypothetical protein
MKTITMTDEQYAYLVCAVENSLRQAKNNAEAVERDTVWLRHRGLEEEATRNEDFVELAKDTQTQYAALLAVVKVAGL